MELLIKAYRHDIANWLNCVYSSLELAPESQYVMHAKNSLDQLFSLLGHLDLLMHPESQAQQIDMRILVEDILKLLSPIIAYRKLQIELVIEDFFLETDKAKLLLLLSNIIANAVDHSAPRSQILIRSSHDAQHQSLQCINSIGDTGERRISTGLGYGRNIMHQTAQELGALIAEGPVGDSYLVEIKFPCLTPIQAYNHDHAE